MKRYTPTYDDMLCLDDAGMATGPNGAYYLCSDVEAALRKIMAEADGCGEHNSKEFHRECLNSVRTIAHLALENRTL